MNFKKALLFIYLVIFPFGQLLSFTANILGVSVRIHPADVVVGLLALSTLRGKIKFPKVFVDVKNFLYVLGFSLVFSFLTFSARQSLVVSLYFFRLVAYSLFFLGVLDLTKKENLKEFLFKSLVAISSFIGIFGLFQYFVYPDVRAFSVWGWDDHLFRLVGTFLDPGFTVIFLVFGFLATLGFYFTTQNKKWLALLGFFLVVIALTYSRAGYFAFLAGLATLLALEKNLKRILPPVLIFLMIVFLIPRWGSEGVALARTRSIFARLTSYSEGIALFSKSPVFGIGYNNVCAGKEKFLGKTADFTSHACSGVESGPLLILATGGLVGFFSFLFLVFRILKNTTRNLYGKVFIASGVSLLTHSLFTNSLFYPWVMGYMGIMLALSIRERS
ncbi:MAG: O-antigen ligase family protein [Patescibacteria group bacterium]